MIVDRNQKRKRTRCSIWICAERFGLRHLYANMVDDFIPPLISKKQNKFLLMTLLRYTLHYSTPRQVIFLLPWQRQYNLNRPASDIFFSVVSSHTKDVCMDFILPNPKITPQELIAKGRKRKNSKQLPTITVESMNSRFHGSSYSALIILEKRAMLVYAMLCRPHCIQSTCRS